jgi:cyclophilin family peptidyl-prolyl cis-trans isomerase
VPTEKRQRQRQNSQTRAAAARAARKRAEQRRRLIGGGVVVVVIVAVVGGLVIFGGGGGKSSSKVATTPPATTATTAASAAAAGPPKAPAVPAGAKVTGTTKCPAVDGSSPRTTSFTAAPPMCIDPTKSYSAVFDTTEGKITVALDTKTTPGTVNNFVVLARYHYYDKSSFDRIDNSIDIIQGGSPSSQDIADPGPGYTIKDEGGKFSYKPGDLVMARGNDANSASAQYFFVVGSKASALDAQGTYVTYGHVTQGLDILQKVEGLFQACDPADQTCLGGAPSHVVLVNTITITQS